MFTHCIFSVQAFFIFTFMLGSNTLNSDEFWASFKMIQNKTVSAAAVTKTFLTHAKCLCQNACQTTANCNLFSWKPISKEFILCKLGGSDTKAVELDVGAKAGYYHASLGSLLGQDLLYYWIPTGTYNLADARSKCLTKPGFRLAVIKNTNNYEALDTLSYLPSGQRKYVDLVKQPNLIGIWGDGTLTTTAQSTPSLLYSGISSSTTTTAFLLGSNQPLLQEIQPTATYPIICQADLDGTGFYLS